MRRFLSLVLFFSVVGCASMQRDCSECNSSTFGGDWLVVQYGYDGRVIQCWRLADASITNEDSSDGIYWKDSDGNLVHISGWYNRVQVKDGGWESAARSLRVDLEGCK